MHSFWITALSHNHMTWETIPQNASKYNEKFHVTLSSLAALTQQKANSLYWKTFCWWTTLPPLQVTRAASDKLVHSWVAIWEGQMWEKEHANVHKTHREKAFAEHEKDNKRAYMREHMQELERERAQGNVTIEGKKVVWNEGPVTALPWHYLSPG